MSPTLTSRPIRRIYIISEVLWSPPLKNFTSYGDSQRESGSRNAIGEHAHRLVAEVAVQPQGGLVRVVRVELEACGVEVDDLDNDTAWIGLRVIAPDRPF